MKLKYHTNISIHTLCFVHVGHSGAILSFVQLWDGSPPSSEPICVELYGVDLIFKAHACRNTALQLLLIFREKWDPRTQGQSCSDRQIWAMLGGKKICFIYCFKDFSGPPHYQMKDSSYSLLSEHTEHLGWGGFDDELMSSTDLVWSWRKFQTDNHCCSSAQKRLYGRVDQWKIVLSERHPKRLHRVTHSLGVFQMCFWKPFPAFRVLFSWEFFVPQQPYSADSDTHKEKYYHIWDVQHQIFATLFNGWRHAISSAIHPAHNFFTQNIITNM